MNGGVEHAAEAGAIDGPAMHAETGNGWRIDAVGPVPYLLRLAK